MSRRKSTLVLEHPEDEDRREGHEDDEEVEGKHN
jgi:hypothetical protein